MSSLGASLPRALADAMASSNGVAGVIASSHGEWGGSAVPPEDEDAVFDPDDEHELDGGDSDDDDEKSTLKALEADKAASEAFARSSLFVTAAAASAFHLAEQMGQNAEQAAAAAEQAAMEVRSGAIRSHAASVAQSKAPNGPTPAFGDDLPPVVVAAAVAAGMGVSVVTPDGRPHRSMSAVQQPPPVGSAAGGGAGAAYLVGDEKAAPGNGAGGAAVITIAPAGSSAAAGGGAADDDDAPMTVSPAILAAHGRVVKAADAAEVSRSAVSSHHRSKSSKSSIGGLDELTAKDKLAMHRLHRRHTIYAETSVRLSWLRSAQMWGTAVVLVFAWLCLPLSAQSGGAPDRQSAFLYTFIHYTLYTCSGVYIGLLLFSTGMPMPNRRRQLFVGCLSLVTAMVCNLLFIAYQQDNFRYCIPITTILASVPFLFGVFQLQRALSNFQDKRQKMEHARQRSLLPESIKTGGLAALGLNMAFSGGQVTATVTTVATNNNAAEGKEIISGISGSASVAPAPGAASAAAAPPTSQPLSAAAVAAADAAAVAAADAFAATIAASGAPTGGATGTTPTAASPTVGADAGVGTHRSSTTGNRGSVAPPPPPGAPPSDAEIAADRAIEIATFPSHALNATVTNATTPAATRPMAGSTATVTPELMVGAGGHAVGAPGPSGSASIDRRGGANSMDQTRRAAASSTAQPDIPTSNKFGARASIKAMLAKDPLALALQNPKDPKSVRIAMAFAPRPIRHYYAQYLRVLLVAISILVTYLFCQFFVVIYQREATSPQLRVVFSLLFPILLFPFQVASTNLATKVDEDNLNYQFLLGKKIKHRNMNRRRHTNPFPVGSQQHDDFELGEVARTEPAHPRLEPLLEWCHELFYSIFYRQLFLNVSDYGTFFLFQFISCIRDIILFPGRMSQMFLKTKFDITEYLCGKDLLNPLSLAESMEEQRRVLCKQFYWNSMSKRVSLSAFALNITLLRYSPNSMFFPFGETDLSYDDFTRLMTFVSIMFIVEWAITAIVYFVISKSFNLDAMKIGGRGLVNSQGRRIAIVFAVHILMDSFISLNKFSSLSWS